MGRIVPGSRRRRRIVGVDRLLRQHRDGDREQGGGKYGATSHSSNENAGDGGKLRRDGNIGDGEDWRCGRQNYKFFAALRMTAYFLSLVSLKALFHVVVRGLAGDDDVVDVGLAQTGVRDADKAGVFLELFDGAAAQVAHAGAQSAD